LESEMVAVEASQRFQTPQEAKPSPNESKTVALQIRYSKLTWMVASLHLQKGEFIHLKDHVLLLIAFQFHGWYVIVTTQRPFSLSCSPAYLIYYV
jgi:hypothetical protein